MTQAPDFSLGISPCPNDTFIFDALLHGRIPFNGTFQPCISDVEELNHYALNTSLDVTKISVAAAARILDDYVLLDAGGAMGRGCGPLLVSKGEVRPEDLAGAEIAIPGEMTTANALLSLHGGFKGGRKEMLFSEIIPEVAAGRVELGVIIHEGRFTYQEHGLRLVLDLGEWWDRTRNMPLPLGIIAARRELGRETILGIEDGIRRSLVYAKANPYASIPFVQQNAWDMSPEIIAEHVEMFVNEFSYRLGDEGRTAVRSLLRAACPEIPDIPIFADEIRE